MNSQTSQVFTTNVSQLTTTGIYFGWYNIINKYKHKNGRVGHMIDEIKGELKILGNGQVEQGDSNHSYEHYDFGARTARKLESAYEDGEDIYEVLEELGWTHIDTEYVLIHNEQSPVIG